MNDIEKALEIALDAHKGQIRSYSNEPYILHPIRVMLLLIQPIDRIVAILHDVIEDHPNYDKVIKNKFTDEIYQSVKILTRNKDEQYFDYINRIKINPIARRVKLSDLYDNLHDFINNKSTQSLYKRYSKAVKILLQK